MASHNPLGKISIISLFVEDVAASKAFYKSVFGVSVIFEDDHSAVVRFENLDVNLLQTSEAASLVEPYTVGGPDAGKRFQISIWVKDLEAVCEKLAMQKIDLLTGPQVQPWGLRTVTFADPAGNVWEVAEDIRTAKA